MKNVKKLGIIPARYGSTRFPGKPLISIGGKTMIHRVYEQAKKSNLDKVVVATDDDRIMAEVGAFGGEAIMTSSELPSGTDRCRAVLETSEFAPDLVVNIQGDEPFIDPEQINTIIGLLEKDGIDIATLVSPALTLEEVLNPNRVKAVLSNQNKALYFSRGVLPFRKELQAEHLHEYFIHLGIYGYSATTLIKLGSLNESSLEKAENLEQLRWIQNGYEIYAAKTIERADAVDTPEDVIAIEKKFFL